MTRELLERRIADARRLLEARTARRAPADMIENVRRELAELEAISAGAQPIPALTGGWWREFWNGQVGSPLPRRRPGERGLIGKLGLFLVWILVGAVVGVAMGSFLRIGAGQFA